MARSKEEKKHLQTPVTGIQRAGAAAGREFHRTVVSNNALEECEHEQPADQAEQIAGQVNLSLLYHDDRAQRALLIATGVFMTKEQFAQLSNDPAGLNQVQTEEGGLPGVSSDTAEKVAEKAVQEAT